MSQSTQCIGSVLPMFLDLQKVNYSKVKYIQVKDVNRFCVHLHKGFKAKLQKFAEY